MGNGRNCYLMPEEPYDKVETAALTKQGSKENGTAQRKQQRPKDEGL